MTRVVDAVAVVVAAAAAAATEMVVMAVASALSCVRAASTHRRTPCYQR